MKRAAMLLILLLILSPAALAAGLGSAKGCVDAFGGASAWLVEAGGSLMSLEVDADTTVTLCLRGRDLAAVSVTAPRDYADMAELAARALSPTGLAREADIARALESGKAQALAGATLAIIAGETRQGLYLYAAPDAEGLCWLPMHGGVCRHLNPSCSGMDVPRLVTDAVADALEFPACSKCAGGTASERQLDDAA